MFHNYGTESIDRRLAIIKKNIEKVGVFQAWTVLVGVMFTAVRDGYYTELRRARKGTSPGLEGERTLASCESYHLHHFQN